MAESRRNGPSDGGGGGARRDLSREDGTSGGSGRSWAGALLPDAGSGHQETPPRVLAISVLALLVASTGAFSRPAAGEEFLGFLWTLALVPPFLLSFYRGWRGASMALGAGMVALVAAEVAGRLALVGSVDWVVVAVATVGLVVVSLGAGVSSELFHRLGGSPMEAGQRRVRRTELERAIGEGEFTLYYQPIVDFEDRKVRGLEALVRWKHPSRGLLRPDEFVALAESTGLIVPLGNWVLEEALRHHGRWKDRFPGTSDLFLSVNFTTRQCLQAGLRERIRDLLAEHEVPPGGLHLEVTEGAVVEAGAALRRLNGLGVGIVLDDFGKGFSSLSQLSQGEVEGVKIDGAFVQRMEEDPADRAVVESILAMARALDLTVTAEGVEEREQFEDLRELGCHLGQGYFFAEPFPVTALDGGLAIRT